MIGKPYKKYKKNENGILKLSLEKNQRIRGPRYISKLCEKCQEI